MTAPGLVSYRCAVLAGCMNSLAITWGPAAMVQYLSARTVVHGKIDVQLE
jgi:hypothetical protein